uniref:UPAR/Ly6 domain-containing protein n=1 Tax=Podarcis muralis TaxID=64176 RepID=A0A670INU5_PODMU
MPNDSSITGVGKLQTPPSHAGWGSRVQQLPKGIRLPDFSLCFSPCCCCFPQTAVVDMLTARGRPRNPLHCYSCSSADQTCYNSSHMQMRCARPEEKCIDITSLTVTEEFPRDEQRIKGCGSLTHCQEPLGFHNHNSFHLIKCCDSSQCNDDTQGKIPGDTPPQPNGVTCFSCEGNSTHGCSPDDITKVQCRGVMTQCLEASGIHGEYHLLIPSHSLHLEYYLPVARAAATNNCASLWEAET